MRVTSDAMRRQGLSPTAGATLRMRGRPAAGLLCTARTLTYSDPQGGRAWHTAKHSLFGPRSCVGQHDAAHIENMHSSLPGYAQQSTLIE